jgi:cytochrome P450
LSGARLAAHNPRKTEHGRVREEALAMADLDTRRSCAPSHVPPELVWDHSYMDFLNELDDPFLAAARLHDGPDIVWGTNVNVGMPAWILTRHALIEEGFADADKFSSSRGAVMAAITDPSWLLLPVEADRPSHTDYRRVLQPFFTPAAMAGRAAEVQGLCDSLIDRFVARGRCEFMGEFASLLPNALVVSLMGLPQEMLPQFLEWEEVVMHDPDAAKRIVAGTAIIDYLKRFIAEQKAGPRSPLMEGVLTGAVDGRPFNDAEILGTCYLLFVAGLDTVFNTLGWIMRELATDPALQTRLRDNPQDIPAAVEEFTRAFGVSAPMRTVAKDMVFHGVEMKKGEDVMLPTLLAGRDPRAWRNPHVIDIDRAPRPVTFGRGAHVCIGIHLARREMKVMIETFLARMRNIRVPDRTRFRFETNSTIGLRELPLEWDPA